MKQVLIVEDEAIKASHLASFFATRHGAYETVVAKSFHSGLAAVLEGGYDLLILDMSLPTYDPTEIEPGGRPRPFGGREILHKLRRKRVAIPAIVVTQFDEFGSDRVTVGDLANQLKREFVNNYRGLVYYDGSSASWKEALAMLLADLESEWALGEVQ